MFLHKSAAAGLRGSLIPPDFTPCCVFGSVLTFFDDDFSNEMVVLCET